MSIDVRAVAENGRATAFAKLFWETRRVQRSPTLKMATRLIRGNDLSRNRLQQFSLLVPLRALCKRRPVRIIKIDVSNSTIQPYQN